MFKTKLNRINLCSHFFLRPKSFNQLFLFVNLGMEWAMLTFQDKCFSNFLSPITLLHILNFSSFESKPDIFFLKSKYISFWKKKFKTFSWKHFFSLERTTTHPFCFFKIDLKIFKQKFFFFSPPPQKGFPILSLKLFQFLLFYSFKTFSIFDFQNSFKFFSFSKLLQNLLFFS